jgi:membrane protease YdiL (CAAX protease family)
MVKDCMRSDAGDGAHPMTPWVAPTAPRWKWGLAFVLLFAVYQSAEGIGGRLLGSFAVQACLMVAALLIAWPIGRFWLRRGGYRAYGLGWNTPAALALAGGLVLAVLGKAGALAAGLGAGIYTLGPAAAVPAATLAGAIALGLVATFIASITEDILTRGVLWGALEGKHRGALFVLLSAAVYVLNHIYRLGAGPTEWLLLLSFGLAYGAATAATGTLWAAVGLHWGWNLSNMLLDTCLTVDADASRTAPLSMGAHLAMLTACVLVGRLMRHRRHLTSPALHPTR